ncbi:MAG: single-stranded DNA-binding protein [Patescibacteria group bacterium]|nr:MAG: single-stranded DNA-binding protein [Patescibacteria group bacterium]
MNLNRAQLIGNLTRDPETRTTPNGQTVSSFGVATSSQWKDASGQKQERVEFHNIVAWGKLAEICQQFLGKGRKVFVEGRLQTREWQGNDGTKKSRTEIVAENMIMLDKAPQGSAPRMVSEMPATTPAPAAPPVEEEIKVEDIPF